MKRVDANRKKVSFSYGVNSLGDHLCSSILCYVIEDAFHMWSVLSVLTLVLARNGREVLSSNFCVRMGKLSHDGPG